MSSRRMCGMPGRRCRPIVSRSKGVQPYVREISCDTLTLKCSRSVYIFLKMILTSLDLLMLLSDVNTVIIWWTCEYIILNILTIMTIIMLWTILFTVTYLVSLKTISRTHYVRIAVGLETLLPYHLARIVLYLADIYLDSLLYWANIDQLIYGRWHQIYSRYVVLFKICSLTWYVVLKTIFDVNIAQSKPQVQFWNKIQYRNV